MSRMMRSGLGLGITALMMAAIGCGGASDAVTPTTAYNRGPAPAEAKGGEAAPAGQGQPGVAWDMGAPSPPPPAPAAQRDVTMEAPRSPSRSTEASKSSRAPEPENRPGLGTEWGE